MLNLSFTLRQLEVFGHVSELRSFRNAAERLGISQASVSKQIKDLEMQLGTRLLARSPGKRPALTSEGQAFVADLHSFWIAAEKLTSHRQNTPVRVRTH
jgi:DNA-binding transcriptional LysR family regulator